MLGGKVVERKQRVTILGQTLAALSCLTPQLLTKAQGRAGNWPAGVPDNHYAIM
jgi:hypothetical protein